MPTRQLGFHQVDVFSAQAFLGNPVAVVHDADGLTTDEMRTIATWTNLSETTFLLQPTDPTADYRVRIFSLATELPFAGHPTLGTARAWLAGGATPRSDDAIVQQCEAGLIDLRSTEGRLAFAAPERTRSGPVDERDLAPILRFLDIDRAAVVDAEWCDNGPGWIAIMLASSDHVLALTPSASFPEPVKVGVIGPCDPVSDAHFEVRAFFPAPTGIFEDPVTGSLNAGLAQWLFATGRVDGDRYVAAQGTVLGRTGRIHVERDADGTIWVGGDTRVCLAGTIDV